MRRRRVRGASRRCPAEGAPPTTRATTIAELLGLHATSRPRAPREQREATCHASSCHQPGPEASSSADDLVRCRRPVNGHIGPIPVPRRSAAGPPSRATALYHQQWSGHARDRSGTRPSRLHQARLNVTAQTQTSTVRGAAARAGREADRTQQPASLAPVGVQPQGPNAVSTRPSRPSARPSDGRTSAVVGRQLPAHREPRSAQRRAQAFHVKRQSGLHPRLSSQANRPQESLLREALGNRETSASGDVRQWRRPRGREQHSTATHFSRDVEPALIRTAGLCSARRKPGQVPGRGV